MYIPRTISTAIQRLITKYPILAITGPRQSGKTTLLRHLFDDYQYVSLENLDMQEYASQDPNGFLSTYTERVIIDEIQRVPQLFSWLQTKTDNDRIMGQYILSGSQNFILLKQITQSLTGRVALFKLLPFTFDELKQVDRLEENANTALFKGFYPAIFDREIDAIDFYPNYIQTYLERDVRDLISVRNLRQFRTFMRLCAGHIGQALNLQALATNCGVSQPTAKSWLSVLESSYVTFTLSPYYRNFNKRLVKRPRLYFYDTGLACSLLGINDSNFLESYYQKGSLFENLIIAELYKQQFHKGRTPAFWYWRDTNGHEIDLVYEVNQQLTLMEIKSSATVNQSYFKNIHYLNTLAAHEIDQAYLVYGGATKQYRKEADVYPWHTLPILS